MRTDKPTKFTGKALKDLTPLLKLDDVRTGDVMLTRGVGFQSMVIAKLGGGEFSHAAIWLPQSIDESGVKTRAWMELSLLEADDYGVGFGITQTIHLTTKGNPSQSLARLPKQARAPMLLRHPGMAGLADEAIAAAVGKLVSDEIHRYYPSLERLLEATTWPPNLQAAMRPAVRRYDRVMYKVGTDPGSFCSELVAKFFEHLALPLFEVPIPAQKVSPNHLVPGRSKLSEVEGAFVLRSEIAEGDWADCKYAAPDELARHRLLPVMVKSSADAKAVRRQVEHVAEMVTNLSRIAIAEMRENYRGVFNEMRSNLLVKFPHENLTRYRNGQELTARLYFVEALDACLQAFENADDFSANRLRFEAVYALREFYRTFCARLSYDYERYQLLYHLRFRRMHSEQDPRSAESEKLRRAIIDTWIASKAAFQKSKSVPSFLEQDAGILIGDPIYLPFQKAIFAAAAEQGEKELASDRAKLLQANIGNDLPVT